jgi:hypothetical protein
VLAAFSYYFFTNYLHVHTCIANYHLFRPFEMNLSAKQSCGATPTLRRTISHLVVISSSILIFLALFCVYGRQSSLLRIHEPAETSFNARPCGSSPADASLAGCHFDHMNLAWQAPACYNGELIRTFSDASIDVSSHIAGVFGSPDASRAVSLTRATAGQMPILYVSREFLRRQCKFRWMELTQALVSGRPVHSLLHNEIWTLQCQDLLLDEQVEKTTMLFPVAVVYPECLY